jgi:hypothetical protein
MMTIHKVFYVLTAFSAILLLTQSGCMNRAGSVPAVSVNADTAGKEAINLFDSNKDGKISGAEFDKAPGLLASLPNFRPPLTKDKGVTAEDITNRIKDWQKSKTNRIGGISCTVLRNGKPLSGAKVKYVPEKYFGPSMPECTGETGPDGVAQVSMPVSGPEDPPGAPPGYYRVEITMADGSIPAKYNTQTTLGVEVCGDRRLSPPIFDLK